MNRIKGIVARRLFASRELDRASLVTLSDPDGKPRLQLKVDSLGQANIIFLESFGRVVRTIKPWGRVIQFWLVASYATGQVEP